MGAGPGHKNVPRGTFPALFLFTGKTKTTPKKCLDMAILARARQ